MKSLKIHLMLKFSCVVSLGLIFSQSLLAVDIPQAPGTLPEILNDFFSLFPRARAAGLDIGSNTFTGVTRDISRDILLSGYHNLTSCLAATDAEGGYYACKSFTLTGATGIVNFSKNSSCQKGGSIFSKNQATITSNNAEIIFSSNRAWNVYVTNAVNRGGAIYTDNNCEIVKNRGYIYFMDNSCQDGGAIYANQNTNIQDNSCPILFLNNGVVFTTSATGNGYGGAIFCKDLNISRNSGPVFFVNNQAYKGGAILCSGNLIIEKNSGTIIFNNNSASGYPLSSPASGSNQGGAIHCKNFTIQDNPGIVVVNNNFCSRDGGGLCPEGITIRNSGPVYFTNNHANWGGAFMPRNAKTCLLFAEKGDIVFNNNFSSSEGRFGKRNAIHCTPAVTLKLGASAGYTLAFFDPVEHMHTTPKPLEFNPEPHHQGTILFSGATVPKDLVGTLNFRTTSRNSAELKNGVLAIEHKAELALFQLTQSGGTLRLGGAGLLLTQPKVDPTNENASITITNLALNLPSILSTGVAPKIWITPTGTAGSYSENDKPTITITGPLSLLDENNNDPYDSTGLAESIVRVPLLYLSDVKAKKINTENFIPQGMNLGSHYGYQGLWSPYWEETTTVTNGSSELTTNTFHRYLYADWTSIGYTPNPEYAAHIVPATLWQTFYATQAGLRTFDNPLHTSSASFMQTQGKALGLFVHQNGKDNNPGFRIDATGYSLGSSTQTAQSHKVSLSFAQFFSNVKERNSDTKVASHTTFSALQFETPWFGEWIYTSAALAYSYGSHHITNFFPTRKETSEGKTFSHTLGASASLYLPAQAVTRRFSVTPFIQAVGIRSILSSFSEVGDKPRKFLTDQPLCNLTIPIGVQSFWYTQFHLPCEWDLEVAYQPTVYQQDPDIMTTLITSGGSWITQGPTVARNSFSFKGSNRTTIFPNIKIFFDYQGSVSSSTSTHYLQAGSQVVF